MDKTQEKYRNQRREIGTKESFPEVQPYVSFPPKFLCFHASYGNPKEFHRVQSFVPKLKSSKIPMFSLYFRGGLTQLERGSLPRAGYARQRSLCRHSTSRQMLLCREPHLGLSAKDFRHRTSQLARNPLNFLSQPIHAMK